MMTSLRLSANQWTMSKLYDKDHPQMGIDRLMTESDYLTCWKQISMCGLPTTREQSANSAVPLWEEIQAVVNKEFCAITVVGRNGRQSYTIDDHKLHSETEGRKHRNFTPKIIKHTADNRNGMVVDTVVCTVTLLIVSLQVAVIGPAAVPPTIGIRDSTT